MYDPTVVNQPVPVAAEPAASEGEPDPSGPAPTQDPTTGHPADADASPEEVVAAGRARRLEWLLVTLATVCAGMLVSLALPWTVTEVPAQTRQMPSGQVVALQGGTVTLVGREVGAVGPVLIAVALAGLVAFCATRRWWYVAAGVALLLVRQGTSVPLPGPRGGLAAPQPAIGLDIVRALWPALLVTIVLVGVQTFLVRQAERDAQCGDGAAPTSGVGMSLVTRALGAAVREVRRDRGEAS